MKRPGLLLAALMGLTGPAALAQAGAPGARLAGHLLILDRDNKPAPDVGDAVVYLESVGGGGGPQARPVTAEIAISDKVYVPHVIVVPVGSTVRFPNHDPFNHNVFSVSEPNGFDLGLYGRGEAKAQTFTAPGLVRVFCNVHPRMVAYVVVLGNRWFAQPSGDGAFAISDVPPGRYRLHVWHERVAAEVVKDVVVTAQGAAEVQVALNARGYRWQPHKNKYGRDYPTNAGRERY
jgi:plastocyanin